MLLVLANLLRRVSRVLRRIRVGDRTLVELLLANVLLSISRLLLADVLLGISRLLLLRPLLLTRLLVQERLRLLRGAILRRHSSLQFRGAAVVGARDGGGRDGSLLGVGGRMSEQREAEKVTDVRERGNEQQHNEGADASDTAQHAERSGCGDTGSLPDGAVAAVDGAAVAGAARGDGYRELASSIGGRPHGRQPEDDHEKVEREYRPRVVGASAGRHFLRKDRIYGDNPGKEALLVGRRNVSRELYHMWSLYERKLRRYEWRTCE